MVQYLEKLNNSQKHAVETTEGPVLILAGAGTGKTRVLTTRFAHIYLTGKALPHQILAVTFTNKASREMSERIANLIQKPVEGLWLGSFHRICAKILRIHANFVGLTSSFSILDTDDQLRLIKQIIPNYPLDLKKTPPKLVLGTIQFWKDKGLLPSDLEMENQFRRNQKIIVSIYAEYQRRLKLINACDFGDLMLHVITIFKNHPEVLKRYQNNFKYILVDEYQDTNLIQYIWLKLIAQREHQTSNICCVGDDDQSIYSWRGAEIENILRFEKDFPDAVIIRLENNYRSTSNILGAASGLIQYNSKRLGKTLLADEAKKSSEKVHLFSVNDSHDEARIICNQIIQLHKENHLYKDIAILVRAGFQTRPFEERMITLGLPYKIIGSLRFYERAEIRDAVAYIRMVVQPADNLALERIINVPKRGIGSSTLQKLHLISRELNITLSQAIDHSLEKQLVKGKVHEELSKLMNCLVVTRNQIEKIGHVNAIDQLLELSGYIDMWKNDSSPDSIGRLENLKELIHALADFHSLEEFLEHISLIMDNDDSTSDNKITLMTLHAAKGLEFETVFLPGWEEGLFPSQRTLDENGNLGLEEERRLAYVGITRAKKKLFISHANTRLIYGNWQSSIPSRFIEELPEQYIDKTILHKEKYAQQNYLYGASQTKKSKKTNSIPSNIRNNSLQNKPTSNKTNIVIGSRVFHQKFGYGIVLNKEQNKLEIQFEQSGIKHIMDNFVNLK
ncbi:ATP-dependent DNA helicase PcrA [Commensalibacter sp. Nvir]|uniref:ATP-dependent helicase n=1 Tax=Commensalibacter sp. Nvir TaxID=3069817 RepID=UPI002D6D1518|nr:ATP-dependent DNA helicase PcrA [Commensalibacter sp. Nvir]